MPSARGPESSSRLRLPAEWCSPRPHPREPTATTLRPHDTGKHREAARSDEIREPIRGKGDRQKSLILRERDKALSDLHTAEATGVTSTGSILLAPHSARQVNVPQQSRA